MNMQSEEFRNIMDKVERKTPIIKQPIGFKSKELIELQEDDEFWTQHSYVYHLFVSLK